MAYAPVDPKLERAANTITDEWVRQLAEMNLSRAAIATQSVEELRASLERVDHLLQDPSPLKTYSINTSTDPATITEGAAPDAGAVAEPRPLLLARRDSILDRLQGIAAHTRSELAQRKSQPSLKPEEEQDIEEKEEQLKSEESDLREQRTQSESQLDRRALELELQASEKQKQLEILADKVRAEIRNARWQTVFGRESIANIIGAVLLIALGLTVIVAMFTETVTTDVVQNSFLLILGYFFGAAVGSRPTARSEQPPIREGELSH